MQSSVLSQSSAQIFCLDDVDFWTEYSSLRLVTASLESRTMMSLMEFTSILSAWLVHNRKHPVWSASALRKPSAYVACVVSKLRKLAPYAAIELLLPGGSMIALLLWFYRRQKASRPGNPLDILT